jgi:hypothetical protein
MLAYFASMQVLDGIKKLVYDGIVLVSVYWFRGINGITKQQWSAT